MCQDGFFFASGLPCFCQFLLVCASLQGLALDGADTVSVWGARERCVQMNPAPLCVCAAKKVPFMPLKHVLPRRRVKLELVATHAALHQAGFCYRA